jgi:photosystem II biogenesis protein Psp29
VNNTPVRTVSDAKRDFYTHHARPINSIYRRVVDELLVEMHLLSVNADFAYDPIYALGVVTTFDRFMKGYKPEADQDSIFNALMRSVGSSPEQYRQDAEALKASMDGMSLDDFKAIFDNLEGAEQAEGIKGQLASIAARDKFKYSRPFGIGLYTLVEMLASEETLKDKDKVEELFKSFSDTLHISHEKLQKDLELYRSNMEKMAQAQELMQDILAAERKKREEREKAAQAPTNADTKPEEEGTEPVAASPTESSENGGDNSNP